MSFVNELVKYPSSIVWPVRASVHVPLPVVSPVFTQRSEVVVCSPEESFVPENIDHDSPSPEPIIVSPEKTLPDNMSHNRSAPETILMLSDDPVPASVSSVLSPVVRTCSWPVPCGVSSPLQKAKAVLGISNKKLLFNEKIKIIVIIITYRFFVFALMILII